MIGATVRAWLEKPEQDISKAVDQVFAVAGRWICDNKQKSHE
jgi:hypothetical protein